MKAGREINDRLMSMINLRDSVSQNREGRKMEQKEAS